MSERPVICQDMQFPLAPLASRHLSGVGGRAQTTAPSGLFEKGHRIFGISVADDIACHPLFWSASQMPFDAFYGKETDSGFHFS